MCRSWCGANRRLTPALVASRRSSPRAAVADQPRPRVGPARMQNRGPIGRLTRCSVQRATCSHPQSSIPTILRFPPLPARTSTDPVFGSRSDSVSASASLIRNPARHRIAISPRVPVRVRAGPSLPHHEDDLLDRRWIGRIAHPLVRRHASRPVTGRRGRRPQTTRDVHQSWLRHDVLQSISPAHGGAHEPGACKKT